MPKDTHLLLPILGFLINAPQGWSQINSPPVVEVERRWTILDTEPVGSVVTRVRGTDAENDPLEYGLDHYQSYNVDIGEDSRPLPFTIDHMTGVVTTNESLAGRAGEDVFLYVTVFDGKMTHKAGVWAKIIDSKKPDQGGSRPQGGVPLQIRPFPWTPPTPSRTLLTSLYTSKPKGGQPHHFYPLVPTPRRPSETTEPTENTSTTTESELATASTQIPSSRPNVKEIVLTVIPVSMVAIASALAVMAAYLFRRKICHTKKKPAKEDMQKKSSNSVGEEPMVMHQWRAPRALSNRYTAWDNDLSAPLPQQDAPSVPPTKSQDRWEFPRHQLKVFSILGEGCFGQVWKCEAKDIDGDAGPKIVAVKTLKENAGERERTDLLQELQVMKMLEPHPNVVRLLGCCTEKDPIFVIMEYVSHGKLQSFLRSSRASRSYDNMYGKSNSLTSRQLTSFCYQVAKGMEFLSSKGIIHRDLAARNILVDTDHTCKVADFGFARDIMASHVYERKSEGRLPIRWMAPESLYDNVFSVKSDVWSFGVLIWEIVTLGSTPYPGLSALEVMKRVKDGDRLEKPEHCRRELYNIMYYCWDAEPVGRPDFKELVDLLGQLLLSETDYIELQRFPDHSYYNIVSLSGEKV